MSVGGVVANAGDAQDRRLPQVLVLDLGDGHIKFAPYSLDDGADDLPLALEVVVLRQVEPDGTDADVHDAPVKSDGCPKGITDDDVAVPLAVIEVL